jgi:hypothetical protein
VSKYKEEARNIINIYLGLIRLPHVGTDILITLNNPVVIQPTSAVSEAANAQRPADEAMQLFRTILHSFNIIDWSLFAA